MLEIGLNVVQIILSIVIIVLIVKIMEQEKED